MIKTNAYQDIRISAFVATDELIDLFIKEFTFTNDPIWGDWGECECMDVDDDNQCEFHLCVHGIIKFYPSNSYWEPDYYDEEGFFYDADEVRAQIQEMFIDKYNIPEDQFDLGAIVVGDAKEDY